MLTLTLSWSNVANVNAANANIDIANIAIANVASVANLMTLLLYLATF